MQTGCGMFLSFSRTPAQSGKRVLYSRRKNPRMPEKPAFIGAIWNFRSSRRSSR
jgi:hypothetical protein